MRLHNRPKICTTYFAKMDKLPSNVLPICIALYPPSGIKIDKYPNLAPTSAMFNEWKRTGDTEEYYKQFRKQVLFPIDVKEVSNYLFRLARKHGKQHVALVCFEKAVDTCHRKWVSEYFYEQEHIVVREYKYERGDYVIVPKNKDKEV